jgi:hypothetical protein
MKGWILILVLVLFIVIGFAIGKLTNKPVVNEIVLPDVSRQKDQIDAKNKRIAADSLLIKSLYVSIDSLSLKKVINHKKLNNDINKLKGFTPYTRNKYIDSIYGAGY